MSAALAIIGALANIYASSKAKEQQPDQINPLTDQRLQDLQALVSQYQPQVNALSGQAQGYMRQQAGAAQKGQALAEDAVSLRQASPNEWFDQFLENVPEYQAVAKEVSSLSQEVLGRDIRQQAERDMEQSLRAAGNATAGQGFSGAASQAAGQAAGQVLGQAGLARQQLASDTFNNTFQGLAGQGQELAFQDQQMQFQNALQQLGQAMGGQFQGANAFGGAANSALGNQSNLINMLNGIQGNIQDITQPVYSSPNLVNKYAGVGNNIAAIGQAYEGGNAFSNLGGTYSQPGTMYDPTTGRLVN